MNAVIAQTARRIPTDSVDPTVKNYHWGDLTTGLFEAYDRGADHVLLLDHAGNLTEGPGYNVFVVLEGRLLTPAHGVLEGITRRTVLELAQAEGLETRETVISEGDLAVGDGALRHLDRRRRHADHEPGRQPCRQRRGRPRHAAVARALLGSPQRRTIPDPGPARVLRDPDPTF